MFKGGHPGPHVIDYKGEFGYGDETVFVHLRTAVKTFFGEAGCGGSVAGFGHQRFGQTRDFVPFAFELILEDPYNKNQARYLIGAIPKLRNVTTPGGWGREGAAQRYFPNRGGGGTGKFASPQRTLKRGMLEAEAYRKGRTPLSAAAGECRCRRSSFVALRARDSASTHWAASRMTPLPLSLPFDCKGLIQISCHFYSKLTHGIFAKLQSLKVLSDGKDVHFRDFCKTQHIRSTFIWQRL